MTPPPAAARAAPTDLSLRRKLQVLVGAGCLLAFAVACGGSASAQGCRKVGERFPRQRLSVRQALDRQGRIVLVEGAILARNGRPQRLCTSLRRSSPPVCGGPSLRLEGFRDLSFLDKVQTRDNVQWAEATTIVGRLDGDTLRLELGCPTKRVRDAFRSATGETLTLNLFGTNSAVERLDAGFPHTEPKELRRRYGYFSILVAVDGKPVRLDLQGRRPEPSGIVWNKDEGRWVAIRRYGPGIALGWLAGRERRLDERWRRLDMILTRIAAE